MQVEVYFGDDACTPGGVYSVRNEVSALTWIFSLIPASYKTQTFEAALGEAVKLRISEVVGAEEEEAALRESRTFGNVFVFVFKHRYPCLQFSVIPRMSFMYYDVQPTID
ncbi:Uncharacterized protein Rs2_38561 [Raphanus sativus]|nr:Uncharacterized protein Rs2_38561 [Raphanus sativus]